MGRLGLGAAPKGRVRATPDEYLRLKALVLARAGRRCEACRGTAGPFEYHHVIERSQGGPDLAWNLLQLCAGCHASVDAPFIRGRLVTEIVWEEAVPLGIRISYQKGHDKRSVVDITLIREIRTDAPR